MLQLLLTANASYLPIIVTLMMEAIRSYKTSVLIRATWCNTPEDVILHSCNLDTYYGIFFLSLYCCYIEYSTCSLVGFYVQWMVWHIKCADLWLRGHVDQGLYASYAERFQNEPGHGKHNWKKWKSNSCSLQEKHLCPVTYSNPSTEV
jgi:hypothetical protein